MIKELCMRKKYKKNLFLPAWLIDILDSEGELYDGPGTVAAASIYHFSQCKKTEKVNIL